MSIRNVVVGLALLAGNQAFGAYFYELSTAGPERLATYNGGGQFRGSLYDGTTLIGTFASQCVDFLNVFPPNTRYEVSVSTLTEGGMATTRWGSWDGSDGGTTAGESSDFDTAWSSARLDNAGIAYTALQRYMMAAWLMTQMQMYTASPTATTNANRNAIQDVIWELLNPQAASDGTYTSPPPLFNGSAANDALVHDWWNAARTNYLGEGEGFYSQFRIITENPINNRDGVYQEQIIRVPEPVDITLALALIAVFWLVRRRRAVPA